MDHLISQLFSSSPLQADAASSAKSSISSKKKKKKKKNKMLVLSAAVTPSNSTIRFTQKPRLPKETTKTSILTSLAPPIIAAIVALSPVAAAPVSAAAVTGADIQRGATLFSRSCIGCHDGGGNIIKPGASLFTDDLKRNGVDTEEAIYQITYFGKGRMPGFGETCTPRGQCTFGPRLKDEEIKVLAEFVKSKADHGWPNIFLTNDD
ncbi:Cytochrome c6, chloroplastic [Linum grandiflorum]